MDIARTIKRGALGLVSFRVLIRGTDIVLEIDGREVPAFSPDKALDIAVGLNYAAKRVKQRYNMGVVAHGIADLTDAVADERQIQKNRDGTASFGVKR